MDSEGEPVHSKKGSKKLGKHYHVSTPSKHSRSKHAPVPPSYAEEYKVCVCRDGWG